MRLRVLVTAAALSLAPAAAFGDDDAMDRARQLGQEGGQAWERGEWEVARQLFHRARELYPTAPTLGLREGRCLVKLGRLHEASLVLARTSALPLDKAPEVDPQVFEQARRDAAAELREIQPRIPHLVLKVEGRASDVALAIDGAPVPKTAAGVEQETDPGLHTITGSIDGAPIDAITLTLAEGERRTVAIPVPEGAAAQPGAGSGAPALRVLGFAALGVGLVGVGFGVGLGVAATSKHDDLSKACPGGACSPDRQGDIDAFRGLRAGSTFAYVAGAALAAGGLALALFAPAPKPAAAARVEPWIGPGAAGVRGTFR